MPRQRERFERSDVPRYNPHRDQIAIVLLVVVGVALVILNANLWGKANEAARTKNDGIASAVEAQPSTTAPDNYTVSTDIISSYLILDVDDVNSDKPQVGSIRLLVMDSTSRTGSLVNVPLDIRVSDGATYTTAQALVASQGIKALVAPLAAATNVRATHVLVTTDAFWDQVGQMDSTSTKALLSNASTLLKNVNTDMSTSDIMDMVSLMKSIGTDNLQTIDAPASQEDNGSGGTWSVIDTTTLGTSVGLLVVMGD